MNLDLSLKLSLLIVLWSFSSKVVISNPIFSLLKGIACRKGMPLFKTTSPSECHILGKLTWWKLSVSTIPGNTVKLSLVWSKGGINNVLQPGGVKKNQDL